MNPLTREIEQAFAADWSLLGRWSLGSLHDEDGLLWYETPIRRLPYNAVIRTAVDGEPGRAIDRLVERLRARGVEFFWLVHPSARPRALPSLLERHGLSRVETVTGMSLELDTWRAPEPHADVVYRDVVDPADLAAFQSLTAAYWELSDGDAQLVERF